MCTPHTTTRYSMCVHLTTTRYSMCVHLNQPPGTVCVYTSHNHQVQYVCTPHTTTGYSCNHTSHGLQNTDSAVCMQHISKHKTTKDISLNPNNCHLVAYVCAVLYLLTEIYVFIIILPFFNQSISYHLFPTDFRDGSGTYRKC